ncbi:LOW QUALITY PROTEIN: hypothetical protein T265_15226 [Opisthorchis viverrini]|uniref:Uncharacterized protein n=1 Tax=Opisthorchis viverrini TaxID=6198 RepID=A0A074ZCF6_OPIVI|nr:LOW QUALITY PROTEIN: hypothetical protein T265_15226 [Opisthorchis viverrini]KER20885.1 LOW QUALITY PROTEIN: hypothetical protein T265_15226 [Opisthorchis viverrini]
MNIAQGSTHSATKCTYDFASNQLFGSAGLCWTSFLPNHDRSRSTESLAGHTRLKQHQGGERWLKWLEREFIDRKVRGLNPTSASRLPLSRLGRPGSISTLLQSSSGMAVKHRKGATVEQFQLKLSHSEPILLVIHRQRGEHWTRVSLLVELIISADLWSQRVSNSSCWNYEASASTLLHQRTLDEHDSLRANRRLFALILQLGVLLHAASCLSWYKGVTGEMAKMARARITDREGLGNLIAPQPSCFLRVAWQLGTKKVSQLNTPIRNLPKFSYSPPPVSLINTTICSFCIKFDKYIHLYTALVFTGDSLESQLNLSFMFFFNWMCYTKPEELERLSEVFQSFGMNFVCTNCKVRSLNMLLRIQGGTLEAVGRQMYRGSCIRSKGSFTDEANARMSKAKSVFSNSCQRWRQKSISLDFKGRVRRTIARHTLLYGCETWSIRLEAAYVTWRGPTFGRNLAQHNGIKGARRSLGVVDAIRLLELDPRDLTCVTWDHVNLWDTNSVPSPECSAVAQLSHHHEGWDTARLLKPRQGKSRGRHRVRRTELPWCLCGYGLSSCFFLFGGPSTVHFSYVLMFTLICPLTIGGPFSCTGWFDLNNSSVNGSSASTLSGSVACRHPGFLGALELYSLIQFEGTVLPHQFGDSSTFQQFSDSFSRLIPTVSSTKPTLLIFDFRLSVC